MDPPHLLPLGFLLLALAAPHPNIAMSNVCTAAGTEDYPTEATVYRCGDCKNCTCKYQANTFEQFKITDDKQNKMCLSGSYHLVTNETRITVCFKETNSCLEEIRSVLWQKTLRSGVLCGTLSSGENGNSNISTEKTICCEAETDTRRYNWVLECIYTQKPSLEGTTSLAGIPGNREVPTYEMNYNCMCNSTAHGTGIGIPIGIPIGITIGITIVILLSAVVVLIGWAIKSHKLQQCCQARSQDTQAEGEDIPLNNKQSTREDPSVPEASSSSSSQDAQQHLNTD